MLVQWVWLNNYPYWPYWSSLNMLNNCWILKTRIKWINNAIQWSMLILWVLSVHWFHPGIPKESPAVVPGGCPSDLGLRRFVEGAAQTWEKHGETGRNLANDMSWLSCLGRTQCNVGGSNDFMARTVNYWSNNWCQLWYELVGFRPSVWEKHFLLHTPSGNVVDTKHTPELSCDQRSSCWTVSHFLRRSVHEVHMHATHRAHNTGGWKLRKLRSGTPQLGNNMFHLRIRKLDETGHLDISIHFPWFPHNHETWSSGIALWGLATCATCATFHGFCSPKSQWNIKQVDFTLFKTLNFDLGLLGAERMCFSQSNFEFSWHSENGISTDSCFRNCLWVTTKSNSYLFMLGWTWSELGSLMSSREFKAFLNKLFPSLNVPASAMLIHRLAYRFLSPDGSTQKC